MKNICLFGACALLAAACTKGNVESPKDTDGPGGASGRRSAIVSVTKSYSFRCNEDLKTLADLSVVFVGADGKPSAPEKIEGLSWSRTGIAVPVSSKATDVEGSTAGVSIICSPNEVPDNGEYDVCYELDCNYTITFEDGTTADLVLWNTRPEMPAVEGKTAEEACNAVSLSCTNDKTIVCDEEGNPHVVESDYWDTQEGAYVPDQNQGGDNQESPTKSVDIDYASLPEAVDLGFTVDGRPLLWATRNVGAQMPGDFGGLYGWGDASGYHTETNPIFYPARHPENVVGKTGGSISGTRCDIAYCNWGTRWRIPSKAEWEALAANCKAVKKQVNGNWGMEFTSKINGQSIFLPGADARYGENLYRESKKPENCLGYYWSGDWVQTDAQMAYYFHFSLFSTGTVYPKAQGNMNRYYGMSIRPVTSTRPEDIVN